jgi:pimeloyl-ACP methyl ester carboxylesterase
VTLLLVHGGLWDDMRADGFWGRTGVLAGLVERGQHVLAPDRPYRAPSWSVEAQALADEVPQAASVSLLAGSNGCSAAVRFALAEHGATEAVIEELLAGETLRGVTDAELAAISVRTAIIPSDADGRVHPLRTVDALCRLIPGALRLPAAPEAPRPTFPLYRNEFLDAVADFLIG